VDARVKSAGGRHDVAAEKELPAAGIHRAASTHATISGGRAAGAGLLGPSGPRGAAGTAASGASSGVSSGASSAGSPPAAARAARGGSAARAGRSQHEHGQRRASKETYLHRRFTVVTVLGQHGRGLILPGPPLAQSTFPRLKHDERVTDPHERRVRDRFRDND